MESVLTLTIISIGLCWASTMSSSTLSLDSLDLSSGPSTAFLSSSPYNIVRGNLAHQTKAFHAKYGNIVRIAPDEISFTDEHA